MMTIRSARAERYLQDLATMLTGLDPIQRADVLESVREHIDSALAELGHEPSEAEVTAVLHDLGPPSQVAEQALEHQGPIGSGRTGTPAGSWATPDPGAAAQPPSAAGPTLIGAWVPPLAVLSILVGSLFGMLILPLLLLIGGIVLVCASSLWTTGQKVAACVVAPLGLLPALPASFFVVRVSPVGEGPAIEPGAVLVPLALLVGIGALIWVWAAGARASSRLRVVSLPGT